MAVPWPPLVRASRPISGPGVGAGGGRDGYPNLPLSSPGELPPEALAEPYVNLSAHTAPVPTPFVFSERSVVHWPLDFPVCKEPRSLFFPSSELSLSSSFPQLVLPPYPLD